MILHAPITGTAGLYAGAVLGWHWCHSDSRRAKAAMAVLGGVGGLFLGVFVSIPSLNLEDVFPPIWAWGMVSLTASLTLIGILIARRDRRRGRLGVFCPLGPWKLGLLVLAVSAAYADFYVATWTGNNPWDEARKLAIPVQGDVYRLFRIEGALLPLLGVLLSIFDQKRERGSVSAIEAYLTALVFGALLGPGLIPAIRRYGSVDPVYKAVYFVGIVVGSAAWAWHSHRRGKVFSGVLGTLHGFITAFVFLGFAWPLVSLATPLYLSRWPVSWLAGFGVGACVCYFLGRGAARRRGDRIVLAPVLLSPLPGGVVLGYVIMCLQYFPEVLWSVF